MILSFGESVVSEYSGDFNIFYVNPEKYISFIKELGQNLRDTRGTITLSSSYEDPHTRKILSTIAGNVRDQSYSKELEFDIEYNRFIEFILEYIRHLGSNKRLLIEIDLGSWSSFDFTTFESILRRILVKKNLSLLNGFAFNITFKDNKVLVHRLSVNGFYPENSYPVETGELFTICETDEAEVIHLYNKISSMTVGQYVDINFDSGLTLESLQIFWEKIRSRLFENNYRWSYGFNYVFKRIDAFQWQVIRLTVDGKTTKVEES